jgi:pilus assembly protein CpaF
VDNFHRASVFPGIMSVGASDRRVRVANAVQLITDRVRDRVRREGVDLASDEAMARRFVDDEVRSYTERALGGSAPMLADETATTREVVASLTGFGALQPLLDDPSIEEIWINAPSNNLSIDTTQA